MNSNPAAGASPLKNKHIPFSEFKLEEEKNFNPIIGKPYNIDKVTIKQIDNLNITYIFTTSRSASTLLGVMLMMHEQVIFTSEEIFPIILKQKYSNIKKWTESIIREYCDDFVIMSEGKLYPLFCGKDVLFELLMKFKEHLNYERLIRISYLSFGVNKDLSKITTIVDKQLRYYLSRHYLTLFPNSKIILLTRDPRDNVYSKYNRAIRKKINTSPCVYIHTWKTAFQTYIQLFQQYNKSYLIIHYENLINQPESTMKQISDHIGIPYTHQYFQYPDVVSDFFRQIHHPKLSEHFFVTHKSLTMPITPQKVNEWKNKMNQKEIADLVNAAWQVTQKIAQKLNYKPHDHYKPQTYHCMRVILKIKMSFVSSYIYFQLIPYFIKKKIKLIKYPYRQTTLTSYDRFLRQSYL
ncbi:MAG: hypothetical protein Fur0023_08460 [Bacteroidia bacterium]